MTFVPYTVGSRDPEMTASVANHSTNSYPIWATTHCLSLFGHAVLHSSNSHPSASSFVQPSAYHHPLSQICIFLQAPYVELTVTPTIQLQRSDDLRDL